LPSETYVQAVFMNTDCDVKTSTGHISLPSELLLSVVMCVITDMNKLVVMQTSEVAMTLMQ